MRAAAPRELIQDQDAGIDGQQYFALILKGSSLGPDGSGDSKFRGQAGEIRRPGRKSKTSRSGGIRDRSLTIQVERASREMKRGFKSE